MHHHLQNKTFEVVLRNVPLVYSDADILRFIRQCHHDIKSVFRIKNSTTGQYTSFIHVKATTSQKQRELLQNGCKLEDTTYIAELPHNRPYKLIRCYSCQRFGSHTAKLCTFTPRCSICSGNHYHDVCESSVIKCANCCEASAKETNHKASDTSCPIWRQKLLELKASKTPATQMDSYKLMNLIEDKFCALKTAVHDELHELGTALISEITRRFDRCPAGKPESTRTPTPGSPPRVETLRRCDAPREDEPKSMTSTMWESRTIGVKTPGLEDNSSFLFESPESADTTDRSFTDQPPDATLPTIDEHSTLPDQDQSVSNQSQDLEFNLSTVVDNMSQVSSCPSSSISLNDTFKGLMSLKRIPAQISVKSLNTGQRVRARQPTNRDWND